jgi:hypothetical protein
MQTGIVPMVKMNCIGSAGISLDPSFDKNAHPPQQKTQVSEYQNQRAFKVSFNAIRCPHDA